MTDLLRGFARILLALVALTAGLIVAASVLAAFFLLLAAWALRAGWARLTGRPVAPLAFGMAQGSRAAFRAVFRRAEQKTNAATATAADPVRAPGPRLHRSGVTDVQARDPVGSAPRD